MVNGCLEYQTRYLVLHFSGDTVKCALCPLLETYARKQCRYSGEYLADGYLVGRLCPLTETPDSVPGYLQQDEYLPFD